MPTTQLYLLFTALDAREIFGFEYTLVFLIVRRAEDIADCAVCVLIDGDEAVLCLAVYIVVAEGREQKRIDFSSRALLPAVSRQILRTSSRYFSL